MESRIDKLIDQYQSGLLTEIEAANSVLFILTDHDAVDSISTLFLRLPAELKSRVRHLLSELRDTDYEWHPFMIGGCLSDSEIRRRREQLRLVNKLIMKGISDEPN